MQKFGAVIRGWGAKVVDDLKKTSGLEWAELICAGAAAIALWMSWMSWRFYIDCQWTLWGDWYVIQLVHGTVTFVWFDHCQFARTLTSEVLSAEPMRSAGDAIAPKSLWEGIGYVVKGEMKVFGVEYGYGSWRPPFVWMHPVMPFQALRVPVWIFSLLLAVWPVSRWCRKGRKVWKEWRGRKCVERDWGEGAGRASAK